jgi:archaemetzincin
MEHCTFFECNMAGSNSLGESDRSPLHLCPVCLRKLQWNRGFDVVSRYQRLLAFYRDHVLDEEAGWMARRIARVEAR